MGTISNNRILGVRMGIIHTLLKSKLTRMSKGTMVLISIKDKPILRGSLLIASSDEEKECGIMVELTIELKDSVFVFENFRDGIHFYSKHSKLSQKDIIAILETNFNYGKEGA